MERKARWQKGDPRALCKSGMISREMEALESESGVTLLKNYGDGRMGSVPRLEQLSFHWVCEIYVVISWQPCRRDKRIAMEELQDASMRARYGGQKKDDN